MSDIISNGWGLLHREGQQVICYFHDSQIMKYYIVTMDVSSCLKDIFAGTLYFDDVNGVRLKCDYKNGYITQCLEVPCSNEVDELADELEKLETSSEETNPFTDDYDMEDYDSA